MPTYAYVCTACDHSFEAVQAITDDALSVCPSCGGALRKKFHAVGVTFKGSGFYRTDSRSGSSGSTGGGSSSKDSAGTSKDSASSTPAPTKSGSDSSGSGGSSGSSGSSVAPPRRAAHRVPRIPATADRSALACGLPG